MNIPELSSVTLLTMEEAADLLKVDKATIRNWRNEGKLKCYKISPRTIRFSVKHIAELLKKFEEDKYIPENEDSEEK